jgi:hypothetical protein
MYKMTVKMTDGKAINLYYDSKAQAQADRKALKAAYGKAIISATISNH